jgi:hypothetical protein
MTAAAVTQHANTDRRAIPSLPHTVTARQIRAVQTTLRRFVTADLAAGISSRQRHYCDSCQAGRPRPGFRTYGSYQLCGGCAAEYEVARLRGTIATIGQYVRDIRFGEEQRHSLATLLLDVPTG